MKSKTHDAYLAFAAKIAVATSMRNDKEISAEDFFARIDAALTKLNREVTNAARGEKKVGPK